MIGRAPGHQEKFLYFLQHHGSKTRRATTAMADSNSCSPRFAISRMAPTDFSEILRPRNRRGGDLTTAPIAPLCWRVAEGDDAEALRRLEYSTSRERKFFDVDPTCHTIKACTPNGEIASFARWNYFPEGYEFEKHEPVDVNEFLPPGALEVFHIDLYRDLRTGMMRLRREWMKKGSCWGKPFLHVIHS